MAAGREMAEQGILTHRKESPMVTNKNKECVVQVRIWKGPEGSEESHKIQGVECSTQGATFYQKMQGYNVGTMFAYLCLRELTHA